MWTSANCEVTKIRMETCLGSAVLLMHIVNTLLLQAYYNEHIVGLLGMSAEYTQVGTIDCNYEAVTQKTFANRIIMCSNDISLFSDVMDMLY